jgi:predicted nucleic acid-binding protein
MSETLEGVLARHRRIAIDSNLLIYLLGGDPGRADVSAVIVDLVGTGAMEGVLATIGLAEALVGPASRGDTVRFEESAATMRDLGFRIVSLDAAVAEDAARIRGQTGLSLPDAVHLASARAGGATAFVTNDRRIRSRPGLEVVYLDDLVA